MIRYANPGNNITDASKCYSGLSNYSAEANSAVSDYRSAKGLERSTKAKALAKCKTIIKNSELPPLKKQHFAEIAAGCDSETLLHSLDLFKKNSDKRFFSYLKSIVE